MDSLDDYLGKRARNPKQREFFDERADQWDSNVFHDPARVSYITGLLGLSDGCDVLDVGTGTGVMVPYYLDAMDGGHVTAIDYSERMISVARSKMPESDRLSYRVQDLYSLNEKECYDRVVCYSCFPHFPDPVEAIAVLTRALRPGGLLCIAHSSSKEHINHVHREGGEVISNDYLPPADLMSRMFSEAGLETVFSRDDDDYYVVIGRKSA